MAPEELLETILEAAHTQETTLSLAKSDLRSLPPEIGLLTHLTALDLSGNRLTSLPPEIGRLTNLRTLSLENNRLPEEVKTDFQKDNGVRFMKKKANSIQQSPTVE